MEPCRQRREVGFEIGQAGKGWETSVFRERGHLLSGSATIKSAPGEGGPFRSFDALIEQSESNLCRGIMRRPRLLLADDHAIVLGLSRLLEPEFEVMGTVQCEGAGGDGSQAETGRSRCQQSIERMNERMNE